MTRRLLGILVVAAFSGLAVPAVATADFIHITTPSKNIDCYLGFNDATADCLVEKASWPSVRPEPPECDLDWVATELRLANGRVAVGSCRGDVGPLCGSWDLCVTLRYGKTVLLPSRVRCTSRRTGLTCRARNGTGAGFTVARAGYRIFR